MVCVQRPKLHIVFWSITFDAESWNYSCYLHCSHMFHHYVLLHFLGHRWVFNNYNGRSPCYRNIKWLKYLFMIISVLRYGCYEALLTIFRMVGMVYVLYPFCIDIWICSWLMHPQKSSFGSIQKLLRKIPLHFWDNTGNWKYSLPFIGLFDIRPVIQYS